MTRNLYDLQPILPKTTEHLINSFYKKLNECSRVDFIEDEVNKIINCDEFEMLSEEDRLSTKLFLQVLVDTTKQGWEFRFAEGILKATPPDQVEKKNKDLPEIKRRIRSGLEEARNEQIKEPSIKKFILNLERPKTFKGQQVSVLNHFLKPLDYFNDLNRRLNAPTEIRDELLENSIDPYIQLANDERDDFTNIKLKDIWRYTRYSWSLPLSSQPGRQMLYLIRDASREFHPIIGIGALGSSIAQISCRDNVIGWTIESLENCDNLSDRFQAMENGIALGIEEIYSEDLLDDEEILYPSNVTLDKLKKIIEKYTDIYSEGKLNTDSFYEDMKKPEYLLKRAKDLHELLHARIMFAEASQIVDGYEKYMWFMSRKGGERSLKVAIRNVKKTHMGSSIMDITTCGAVPPYNEVLGGKLVSLLMASPQVINDYYIKYESAVSEIASRKKGQKVIKPAKLALLATTSLYHTGSSQYNRIKYSTAKGTISYKYVGKTRGFGSVQISSKAYKTLQNLLKSHSELKPANSTFSAGVNYKMRSISTGLGHLGLRKLQQHENPRLVYIVPLLKNWQEYLTGTDKEPDYIYEMKDVRGETQEIVKHWYKRWYIGRVKKTEIINRMKTTSPIKISNNFKAEAKESVNKISVDKTYQQLDLFGGVELPENQLLPWESLAELKDQRTSFAEKLTAEELEVLHIQTKLDSGLIDLLNKNKRIYLVGSPGDGKTHIIKKYIPLFPEGTFYNLDASAIDENELTQNLTKSIENNLPSIIAINEGPFRKLLKKLPSEEAEVLRIQLERPYLYGEEDNVEYDSLVINLGIRQVLSPPLLDEAINIVLKKVDYESAPKVVKYNVEMLQRSRVKDRLSKVLSYLTKNGKHITMHQLLGFLAFIITNGVNKNEYLHEIKPYYNAVFDDNNPLYVYLNIFDPVKITHPIVDMGLYDGVEKKSDDLINEIPVGNVIPTNFSDLKRKYFFESEKGEDLLKMLPEDYQTFYDLLDNKGGARRAKRKIVEAISSYFGQTPEENKLQVWTGLKYEAKRDPTVFISSNSIGDDQIEIYIPSIRPQSKELLEFVPSTIRLLVKPNPDSDETVGLDVDLELWLSLMKIKRGISNLYQDPVIVRRLTTFMSQLASQLNRETKSDVTIRVQDTETGSNYEVDVSYEYGERGKYNW